MKNIFKKKPEKQDKKPEKKKVVREASPTFGEKFVGFFKEIKEKITNDDDSDKGKKAAKQPSQTQKSSSKKAAAAPK